MTTEEQKKERKLLFVGLGLIVAIILLIFAVVMLLFGFPEASAQFDDEIENEIKDFVEDQLDESFDKITEDIDFESGNILNTNEEETDALKDAGKTWFKDMWKVLWSTKDVAHAGVEFASPFEINAIVVSIVSGVIAISFFLTVIKKIAWHIFVTILVVLVVGALIVYFKLIS